VPRAGATGTFDSTLSHGWSPEKEAARSKQQGRNKGRTRQGVLAVFLPRPSGVSQGETGRSSPDCEALASGHTCIALGLSTPQSNMSGSQQDVLGDEDDEILPALPAVADTNVDAAAQADEQGSAAAASKYTADEDFSAIGSEHETDRTGDTSASKSKYKSIAINLLSGKVIEVDCVYGRYTTGEQLHDVVSKDLQMDAKDAGHFALWVVSASLQLQVKPHHLPFKVMKKWSEILESFATGDIYSEVPTLYLKRDALLHPGIERKLKDPKTIELLFDELAHNIAYSFYPVTLDEAVHLAAKALRADRLDMAKKGDIRNCIGCYLPPHLERKVWGWTWRKKVWAAYKDVLKQEPALDATSCRQQYLEIGFTAGYYGATFFYGGLEHEKPGMPDKVVRIGVNLDGIHVIEDRNNDLLLSLPYDEFHYNSYESVDEDDSFLIEYEADGEKQSMVIWGPQSNIVDTLVTAHIEELEKWTAHLKQRASIRKSFKPSKTKGRKIETSEERKFFTIGRAARRSTMFIDQDDSAPGQPTVPTN